jgi:hypothetical protein
VAKKRNLINGGDDLPSLPTGVFISTPTPRVLNDSEDYTMNIPVNTPFRNKCPKRTPKTANGDMAGKQGRPHNEVQEGILCVH